MKLKLVKHAFFLCSLILFPLNAYSEVSTLYSSPPNVPAVSMPAAHPLYVIKQKLVTVDMAVLAKGEAESVGLSFFSETFRKAVRTSVTMNGDQGFVWFGHIPDLPGSSILFVADPEALSGVMQIPPHAFKLRPLDHGLYLLRQIETGNTDLVSDPNQLWRVAGDYYPTEEQEVLQLVNQERAQNGLHALSWNETLAVAARGHSLDMATQDYFSHTSQDGREFHVRITEAGYQYSNCGENIAYGYGTPTAVMEGWMNSDGHRRNILGESFCEIGIGIADHANTGNRLYWTQNFGRQQGVNSCPTPTPTPGDNQLPVAVITAQPVSGPAALMVDLDASQSHDPDGEIVRYLWDFGDGQSGSGVSVQHEYTAPGTYSVSLTVADDDGAMNTRTEADMISVSGSGNGGADDDDSDGGGGSGCFITTTVH